MARSPPSRRHEDSRSHRHRSTSRDVRYYRNRSYPYLTLAQGRGYDSRDSYSGRRDPGHYQRDRRDDRYYESSRRRDDRPRDYDDGYYRRDGHGGRKRSRERGYSPVRRESRYVRDGRDYSDRDSKRVRRDSPGRPVSATQTPTSSSTYSLNEQSSRPSTADAEAAKKSAEEQAAAEQLRLKQERQAKLEAWKQKRLAEGAPSTAADSPIAGSSPIPRKQEDASSPADREHGPPSPPRGKFDPSAIKKRAEAAMAKAKGKKAALGDDAAIPASTNGAVTNNTLPVHTSKGTPTNSSRQLPKPIVDPAAPVVSGDAKISRFGVSKSTTEKVSDKMAVTGNDTTTLDDEEEVRREFKELPQNLPQDLGDDDDADFQGEDDQDDGDDLRSEEEEAEAAREAAQRRAEGLQAGQQPVPTSDAPAITQPGTANDPEDMDADEEEDPLDAFMKLVQQPKSSSKPKSSAINHDKRTIQVFDEEDGPELEAVGDDPEDLLNKAKLRKKKELPNIDHSKMDYKPFRKAFYSEPTELAEMTEEDVTRLRFELDNIKVRGPDVPKPITKWPQCGFGTQILDVIREQKFEKPTAIQCQALPAIMSGRDTIGVAKTGSGKTVAFVLPMVRHIKDQPPLANLDGPVGLILAPTRELTVQIHRECKRYLSAVGLRSVAAYGGAPIKDQIAELKRGAEVVVCTPGRMIDLLAANAGRVINLRRVTYVVIDEADRMFDMGFEPQINKILQNVRPDRQAVFFSATFPHKMEALARKALKSPVEIQAGGRPSVAPEITQIIEIREANTKFDRVLELLGKLLSEDEDVRVLIFVERHETANSLWTALGHRQYPSVPVHGGRDQIDRDQAIDDFKRGHFPIMVATSVCARGLDVKQLKLVINFDAPNHGEDYVHRVGRTGRAGNTGTAVTFVTPEEDRFAPYLVRALKDSKTPVPDALQALADTYNEKIKSGEVKQAGWGGFGGKGIERLDAARAAARAREKRTFKTDDDPDDEEEADEGKDKKKAEVDKLVAKAIGVVQERDAQPSPQAQTPSQPPPQEPASTSIIPAALSNALKSFATVKKSEVEPRDKPKDALTLAKERAAGINSRLAGGKDRGKKTSYDTAANSRPLSSAGTSRTGGPPENRGPDAGAFHTTIEINDFPQRARWAVTNRTNVAKILEATGTSITSKGIYYAKGKEPGPDDEPKLYILVEGDTEIAVSSAVKDLTRHLTDGMIQAADAEGRSSTAGRYNVV